MKLPDPTLQHACDLSVELGSIHEMGSGRAGQRRIIPITGGMVSGPLLQGNILDIGADWQTLFDNNVAELDTRYAMETHDGAIIEIINYGFRHGPQAVLEAIARGDNVSPDEYYMRTHARLETGDERYSWVNRTLFIGVGARSRHTVLIQLYALR